MDIRRGPDTAQFVGGGALDGATLNFEVGERIDAMWMRFGDLFGVRFVHVYRLQPHRTAEGYLLYVWQFPDLSVGHC